MSIHADGPRWPLIAVGLLLTANVVVPLLGGDVYPFTSAPMFRDAPTQCCNYRVFAADGRELPAADWLLARVYDGNPVGYGVGVRHPAIIEQEFGFVPSETEVRRHVERQFALPANRGHAWVDVVQEVIGPTGALTSSERVGVVRTHRWRVARP